MNGSQLVGKILRVLALLALVLAVLFFALPLAPILAPAGIVLLAVIALVATGKAPTSWLTCIDPKDVGKVASAAGAFLIVILATLAMILLPGPAIVAVVALLGVLFALGWSGIGPLTPLATFIRGIIQLIRLLPSLRPPLQLAYEALLFASNAVDGLRNGLDDAQTKLGNFRASLAGVNIVKVNVQPTIKNVTLPTGGSVPVPGWDITSTPEKPFDGTIGQALDVVQQGLLDARKGAETERDRLKDAGAALKTLHDLLPDS